MPIVLKSGSLNLLEPSGPVQACNATALSKTQLKCYILLVNLSQDTAIFTDPRQIEFIFVCYSIKHIPSDARVFLGACPTFYSLDSIGSSLLSKVNKASKVCY